MSDAQIADALGYTCVFAASGGLSVAAWMLWKREWGFGSYAAVLSVAPLLEGLFMFGIIGPARPF